MKNRSADATLLGFYYQFDKTIHTILEQVDENNIITVEGIEDVDIKTINEESVIQIKYQAETNGTDSVLRKELKKYTKDATILIVAQRIGTIMNADKIIVLDNGKCAGIGTHKELLKTCDVYKEIAMSQLSEEELIS